jgi:predicted trehalose synthase
MRTPVALPPILKRMEQRMPERRRFTQATSPEERLAEEAKCLRKQAQGTPPGIERERLVRRARQAETASRMNEWLASRGLQAPKQGQ